jgi:hypothetical protein
MGEFTAGRPDGPAGAVLACLCLPWRAIAKLNCIAINLNCIANMDV